MSSTVRIPVSFSCREPAPGDYPLCAWIAGSSNRWHDFHVVQTRWPEVWTHWLSGTEFPTQSPQELIAAIKANPPANDDPRWKSAVDTPPKPEDYPIWLMDDVMDALSFRESDDFQRDCAWEADVRWLSVATPYPELPEVPATLDRRPTKAELERDFEEITSGEIQAGDWLPGCGQWAFGLIGCGIGDGDTFLFSEDSVFRRKPKAPVPPPAPAPVTEPISPPLAVGDRVKLVSKQWGVSSYNPVWGSFDGYVVGKVSTLNVHRCLPVNVIWDNGKEEWYLETDLARATAADERLAKAWALPVPEGWRALGTHEKIIEGVCWIDTVGMTPVEAHGAIEGKDTVAEAHARGYANCKFIRRADTLKASEAQSPTSFQAESGAIFPTSDTERPSTPFVNIQDVPKSAPVNTIPDSSETYYSARYVAGLQRKNEAQRKALAALHEKLARTQDELKEARVFKSLLEVSASCTTSSPYCIHEQTGPCGCVSWTPAGLLAEKNQLKKELEDRRELGRKNMLALKATLSEDEKQDLAYADSNAQFFADLITGLKNRVEVADRQAKLDAKAIATLTDSLAGKGYELAVVATRSLEKTMAFDVQKREIDSLKTQIVIRDGQLARQAQTIENHEQSQRTALPDTCGIPTASDRWKDGRTGVVWVPEVAVSELRDDVRTLQRALEEKGGQLDAYRWALDVHFSNRTELESRLTKLDEWLKANAVWKSVRLCDNNDTVEQKVEHLVACWRNQADALDRAHRCWGTV